MSFTRTKEDFVCEHCGEKVTGNGYTNHCPKCLWSKHVDVDPGDRAEPCHGLMQPLSVTVEGGKYTIIQSCKKCRKTRSITARPEDDFEALVELSTNPIT